MERYIQDKDKERQEVTSLAWNILSTYYRDGNPDYVVSNFSEDIIWVGSGRYQMASGKEAVSRWYKEGKTHLIHCVLQNETYEYKKLDQDTYLCQVCGDVRSEEGVPRRIDLYQRTTFLFKRENGALKAIYIHNSKPYAAVQEKEIFPENYGVKEFDRLRRAYTEERWQGIRNSELVYLALKNSSICDYSYNPKTHSIDLPDYLANRYGWERHYENMPMGFAEAHIEESSREAFCQMYQAIDRGERLASCEFQVMGTDIWIRNSMSYIEIEEDGTQGIAVGIVEDISLAKKALAQAEREKEQMTHRFIQAVSGLYEAIYEADVYANAIYVWKEARSDLSGTMLYESLEQHFQVVSDRYVHPDFKEEFLRWTSNENIRRSFESGKTERSKEIQVSKTEGGYKWIRVLIQVIEKTEESLRIMIYTQNIDEQKREEIRRREANLEAIQLMKSVSSSYDMLISANLTQNTYYMIGYDRFLNHSAEEKGNFDELIEVGASTVPESHREQFAQCFCRKNLLEAYYEGKPFVYLEHPQMGDDGVLHWVSTQVMFTENPYNDDVMEITLSRCIDDIREKEEKNKKILRDALQLAERANRAKTDFLSRMSHDIRTPLNAIIGMTSLAAANLNDPKKMKDYLSKISSSSGYLLGLISDLLDLSHLESGKMSVTMEPFEFMEVINSVSAIIGFQTVEKNQKFTLQLPDDLEPVYIGDELRLRQVLMNLLSNAHKYTGEGGDISLEIRLVRVTMDHVQMRFIVTDNGTGISPGFLEKIFDPFVQDSNASGRTGSGLGLAITQNLVHLMNGAISVKSEYGHGSCFTVDLPFKRVGGPRTAEFMEQVAEVPEDVNPDEINFNGQRILLAEDNEINQEIACTMLEMKNLRVEVAENGKVAQEKFQNSPQGYYDMILMDLQMPLQNGFETAEAIRESDHPDAKTIPIYAMTANAYSGDVTKAISCGMNGHIAKPVDLKELILAIYKEIGLC